LFRVAEEEFSLALLGPWGRGKTTIAGEIKRYLTDSQAYANDLTAAFRVAASPAGLARYETVTFSAWTYRRQPELWIWLYESFVRAFLAPGGVVAALRVLRCGVAKHGIWPLGWSLITLAVLALPFAWIAAGIKGGVALFGAAGLISLALLGRRWFGSVRRLVDRYGVVASHRERLGLQALVGEDLKAIVDAWVTGGGPSKRAICVLMATLLITAGVWAWIISDYHAIPPDWRDFICLHAATLCESKNDSQGAVPSVPWLAWGIWVFVSALASAALAVPFGRIDRILVIVDDLDRCPPEEIVDLIDGIKLMLEEQHVGSHVQALVLADNNVLQHAISKRFKDFIATDAQNLEMFRKRVIREHMEKVFICHFLLKPLEHNDVAILAKAFAKEF
jgi:hypothetical protein